MDNIEQLIEEASYIEDEFDLEDSTVAEIQYIIKHPILYIENNLKIIDKYGNLVPLKLNYTQRQIEKVIEKLESEGKPVRLIILKARQEGVTTFVTARYYWKVTTRENTAAGICTHVEKISTDVLEKSKLFYDESPPIFKPMRKSSTSKRMLFENPSNNDAVKAADPGLHSKIVIESAVNKTAFRGMTIQHMHLSELAFWPYPQETMRACMQAVPDHPDTSVIIESTANGIGNLFYNLWMRSINKEKATDDLGTFIPLFFPWFVHEEYTKPVPQDFELTDDERELKEKYDLTDGQIAWRRWCIDVNCSGDINTFRQEYPSEWREAFLASGRPVFQVDKIDLAIQKAQPPEWVGRVMENGKFRSEYGGRLSVWKKPEEGKSYVMGVDTSGGDRGGDPACIAVYDHEKTKCVAEWHGFAEPDVLAIEAMNISKWYNNAMIMPEANNHGVYLIGVLKRLGYRYMFRRKQMPDNMTEDNLDKYGFWTEKNSKIELIDTFGSFLSHTPENVTSVLAMNECITYVYDDSNKMNAQEGCHDDRVIAHALAVWAIKKRPFVKEKFVKIPAMKLYGGDKRTGY